MKLGKIFMKDGKNTMKLRTFFMKKEKFFLLDN